MTDHEDVHGDVTSLRALAHPVRLRILSLLTGSALSAAEVARELGLTHANASYHLRVLADAGEVVAAGEERIRGGTARRYRHPWDDATRGQHCGAAAGSGDREPFVKAMAAELTRRFVDRRPRTRTHLTDAELWVSPETWDHARALVEEAARLVHAEARPPRTRGTLHVSLSAALFEMRSP